MSFSGKLSSSPVVFPTNNKDFEFCWGLNLNHYRFIEYPHSDTSSAFKHPISPRHSKAGGPLAAKVMQLQLEPNPKHCFSSTLEGVIRSHTQKHQFNYHYSKGLLAALNYLVKHVNPNRLSSFILNPLQARLSKYATKQQGAFTSKAIDFNLSELCFNEAGTFWLTRQNQPKALSDILDPNDYNEKALDTSSAYLSEILQELCQSGKRYIASIPQTRSSFSLAINLFQTAKGNTYALDGIAGKLYDLGLKQHRQQFNKKFGLGTSQNILRLYRTGDAPSYR